MQKEKVIELVSKMVRTYPNTYGDYGREDKELLVDTWTMALEDYDDDSVMRAFKAFLISDQKGFPPSVGQIVARIPNKGNIYDKTLTPGEAWVLVLNAMKNVTYQPREAFDSLPELIQKIIGGVDALREMSTANDKGREIEKQRFLKEYANAVSEAKAAGEPLPERGYRDEDMGAEATPRNVELRRSSEWFPGCIEIGNPRTGTVVYVQYEGYPYGAGGRHEHGGLNDEELKKWHEKIGGKNGKRQHSSGFSQGLEELL